MSFLDFPPDPKQVRPLKLFLIGTLAAGALASVLGKPTTVPIAHWLIAPLWTLSYGLMAVAAWLAWKHGAGRPTLAVYGAQIGLNLIWRILPFPLLAMLTNIMMLATLVLFGRRNWRAGLTFLPCIAWSLFISVPINGL